MTELVYLRQRLERAVDRCCPTELRADRDDLVQTALIKAHQALERDQSINSAWLTRIAYTTMIDALRRRRDTLDDVHALASPAPDPERRTHLRRMADALRHCMGHLHDVRRRAVLLFLAGHSAAESASLLGLTRRAAENAIFRGRNDLRQCLAKRDITVESLR